ncbi:MAG: hypothetical protein JKY84_05525 [Emcibacteraceae bacterium]|nr:hypothetical protein [Emcibacteraceae bacterium]
MFSTLTTINGYNPIKALFLKEYWDNKRAILATPMVVTGLVIFFSIVSLITGSGMTIDGASINEHLADAESHSISSSNIVTMLVMFPSIILFIVVSFSMVFTALSSLFDERKDKSILFWKSMPVSDTQEVLVKLATVTVVIPLIAIGFALIIQIFSTLILGLFVAINTDASAWNLVFSNINLGAILMADIVPLFVKILWVLPIITWFMLVSSFSRRSPFLLAFIAPILLAVFEMVFFRSTLFLQIIGSRFTSKADFRHSFENGEGVNLVDISMNYLSSLTDPSLWIGTIIAAIMIAGCIQIRKRNNIT